MGKASKASWGDGLSSGVCDCLGLNVSQSSRLDEDLLVGLGVLAEIFHHLHDGSSLAEGMDPKLFLEHCEIESKKSVAVDMILPKDLFEGLPLWDEGKQEGIGPWRMRIVA